MIFDFAYSKKPMHACACAHVNSTCEVRYWDSRDGVQRFSDGVACIRLTWDFYLPAMQGQ